MVLFYNLQQEKHIRLLNVNNLLIQVSLRFESDNMNTKK